MYPRYIASFELEWQSQHWCNALYHHSNK